MKKALWFAAVSVCPMMLSSATWGALTVDFNDGLGANSFTTIKSSAAAINYAFDYSTYHYYASPNVLFPISDQGEIPQAPNSPGGSPKLALRMAARTVVSDPLGWVTALPNFTSTGAYRMKFDMWINYNGPSTGGAGSTEFAISGLNTTGTGFLKGTDAAGQGTLGGTADGYATAVDGEGGTTIDYAIFSTDPSDDGPGYAKPNATWGAESQTLSPSPHSSANPYYSQAGLFGTNETAGAPGKSWVQVTVEQVNPALVNWYFNGILISSLRLETPTSGLGTPFVGYYDNRNGAPPAPGTPGDSLDDSFVLIDNLSVEALTVVPEPGVAALAIGGAIGALSRRRKH